jgi:hypothetical protein
MTRSKRRWPLALGLFVAVGVVGLALAWNQATKIHVKLDAAALRLDTSGSSAAVVADTTFEVYNRNFVGGEVTSLEYVVSIAGREVGTGAAADQPSARVVPAWGTGRITTSTRLRGFELASAGVQALLRRRIDIEVRGKIRVTVLGLAVERQFQVQGPALVGGVNAADIHFGAGAVGARH